MDGSRPPGARDTAGELRAAVRELLRHREFGRATALLEACGVEEKGAIRSLWYEVHYMKLKEQLGKNSLTAVQRFRCRKRNPPPRSLCPEELKTRSLPLQATQHLRAWAEGNHATPSVAEREGLVQETGLEKQQIYNWFANYRRRQKRVKSQRERAAEFRHRLMDHSPRTHTWSSRCPQIIVRGSTRLPTSGDDSAADMPCVVKEEQGLNQRTTGADYTVAQRPALTSPQCCCLGCSTHQLLPETDPVALLNAASSYWLPDLPGTLAPPNRALCACLSMAADLAHPYPMMGPSQPAYPDELLLSGSSKFERTADLDQYYASEELLNQAGLSLYNSAQLWQVPLPIFPTNPSQFHLFNKPFLTSGQRSDIGACLKEEPVTDGYLLRSPVGTGFGGRAASETQREGSPSDEQDRGWLKVSPSNASLRPAPVLDGEHVTPRAGDFVGDTERVPGAVAGDGAETCRGIERGGLNQPSQWTLGAVSVDASPQNNLEHVEIDYRRLTQLKVESEERYNPEYSQVQLDTKLDIAAQALIQLSQRPASGPSG